MATATTNPMKALLLLLCPWLDQAKQNRAAWRAITEVGPPKAASALSVKEGIRGISPAWPPATEVGSLYAGSSLSIKQKQPWYLQPGTQPVTFACFACAATDLYATNHIHGESTFLVGSPVQQLAVLQLFAVQAEVGCSKRQLTAAQAMPLRRSCFLGFVEA